MQKKKIQNYHHYLYFLFPNALLNLYQRHISLKFLIYQFVLKICKLSFNENNNQK